MPIGDNRFSRVEMDFNTLLALNGVDVTVSRTIQTDVQNTDIYGEPIGYTPKTLNNRILVIEQYLDETMVIAGGKPKEILKFIALPESFIENDEFPYNSHSYQVTNVGSTPLGGNNVLQLCVASRQVEQ